MYKRRFLLFSLFSIIFTLIKIRWINPFFAKIKNNQTKILTHRILFKNLFEINHPESPERLKSILNLIKDKKLNNLVEEINLKIKVNKWIKTIHSKEHINSLKSKFPVGEQSSSSAVKACIQGVDEIMKKNTKNIFCAVRPPGHHALNTGKHEGFCFYNHIAIAAKYIQIKHKIKRILIVDWDYHHGNSTELFFYNDPTVLFFSTHDVNAYPGTGLISRKGNGKGRGFNINIHLPCGTRDNQIIKIFNKVLISKAKDFHPEFILISAGFDSRADDPLGCFNITDKGFEELTTIVLKLAEEFCDGRVLSVLEGGYNIEGNAKAVISHVKVLNNFNKNI